MKTRDFATTTFAAIAEEGFIYGLPIVLPVPEVEKEMVKTGFFDHLGFALWFALAGPEKKEIRTKLASIGVGPGKTFDFKDLSMEHKAAVQPGMKEGTDKGEKAVAGIGKTINGWGVYTAFDDRAFSTATGSCEQQPLRSAFTATTRRKRCIRNADRMQTAPGPLRNWRW